MTQDELADMRTVKARLVEILFIEAPDARTARESKGANEVKDPIESLTDDAAAIEAFASSLRAEGSWGDIDYADGSYTAWAPTHHLVRTANMARALRRPGGKLRGDGKLRAAVFAALDFWLRKDFRHPGWWWNQIGIQERLAATLLLMEDELSPTQVAAGIEILRRSVTEGFTGANLLWAAGNEAIRGCLADDAATVAGAYRKMAGEIRVAEKGAEGIKADNSFFQHGELLYSGGYGLAFSVYCARFAFAGHGTRFAFPEEKMRSLSSYILDGQRWMMRGRTFDYGAVGREIARKGKDGRPLLYACECLARLPGPRQPEFVAFAASIRENSPSGIVGNRHFWKCDIMVHQRPEFYASARMLSPRVDNSEYCIGENRRAHYLSDGATFVLRDGSEYDDIFPAWDWRRIPGITVACLPEPFPPAGVEPCGGSLSMDELSKHDRSVSVHLRSRGKRSFVGGVSDGEYGVAAMDFERGALTARKSWFFFDREFVCLGAGIRCASEDPVLTSIAQCLLRGPVAASDGGRESALDHGERELKGVLWVQHDGIGYVFPRKADVVVKIGEQRGNWRDITGRYGDDAASKDVFSLWLDHGRSPAGAEYRYVVVPSVTREELARHAADGGVEVLANAPDLQAVFQRRIGVLGAAFWAAGRLSIPGGLSVAAEQPCLLLMRKDERGGRLVLAVACPDRRSGAAAVEIGARLEGDGCFWIAERNCARVVFDLPSGEESGRSAIRILRKL